MTEKYLNCNNNEILMHITALREEHVTRQVTLQEGEISAGHQRRNIWGWLARILAAIIPIIWCLQIYRRFLRRSLRSSLSTYKEEQRTQ